MLLIFYNIKLYYYNSIKNSTAVAEIVVTKAVYSEFYHQQQLLRYYYYYYCYHNIINVYLYIFSFTRVIRTLSEVYCQNPDKVAICQTSCDFFFISLLSLLLFFYYQNWLKLRINRERGLNCQQKGLVVCKYTEQTAKFETFYDTTTTINVCYILVILLL